MHFCTHPGETIDQNSKLVELTINQLTKKSKEDPNGLVEIPTFFEGEMGGAELIWTGKPYYMTWKEI